MVDRKGEEVVPQRPRCITKTQSLEQDFFFNCTLSCSAPLLLLLVFHVLSWHHLGTTPQSRAALIVIPKRLKSQESLTLRVSSVSRVSHVLCFTDRFAEVVEKVCFEESEPLTIRLPRTDD